MYSCLGTVNFQRLATRLPIKKLLLRLLKVSYWAWKTSS